MPYKFRRGSNKWKCETNREMQISACSSFHREWSARSSRFLGIDEHAAARFWIKRTIKEMPTSEREACGIFVNDNKQRVSDSREAE